MRKIAVLITVLVVLITLGGAFSVAWLGDNGMLAGIGVTSHVHKSYFESGDGTGPYLYQTYDAEGNPIIGTDEYGNPLTQEGCAFEIKYPVQLYYFAWLQYFGYFNQPEDGDGKEIDQVYFYLSADIDMSQGDWVLPPIGTKEFPFVGNFDGNGHTIYNLKIKNLTGLTDDPVKDTDPDAKLSNTEIVGFFGVVGSPDIDGLVNGAVDNNGMLSADPDYSYDVSINEIKNFILAGTTQITTETNNSLIGIVAGYVNGKISNVRVSSAASIVNSGAAGALASYTNNLSDYTLMGYVTDAYKDTSDVVYVKIGTPTTSMSQYSYASQGSSVGWGGSIDMKSMFNRLISVRTKVSTITSGNHVVSEVRWYSADGTLVSNITTGDPPDSIYRIYKATINNVNNGSGQYVFSYVNNSDLYNYLASTYKDVTIIQETNETEPAFYIKSGSNYLNMNSNGTGITNGSTAVTKWVIEPDGYIRTQTNNRVYYLNSVGMALVIGTSGSTVWTKTGNAIYCSNGYIQYDTNGWKVLPDGNTAYYYISYTSFGTVYYLNENNGSISRGTTASTRWYRSGSGTGTLSTKSSNGNVYFLYTTGANGNLSLSTASSVSPTIWTFNSNGRISYTSGSQTLYICAISNAWTCSRYNNIYFYGKISQGGTELRSHDAISLESTTETKIIITTRTEGAEFSYIPLSASETTPYTVENGNTGYIIGGSHETTSDRKSDIRISRYSKSDITSALTGIGNSDRIDNTKVMTVKNDSITTINVNDYQKYNSSVGQFNSILSNTTYVYGLHFMDALISIDHLVVAPTVLIEGQTYYNYEMPEDCIDFIVYQQGYVNFFAGTYFSGNNSFFSLHVIERDENKKITAIREIQYIYKSTSAKKPYIYLYKDGTYSGTLTSDYSLVFNTDWITKPGESGALGTTNVFYFEIPVNAGEYALGAVEGRIGAYLMYLDIAANAQLVNRATVVENFEETVRTYEYPVGATFAQTGANTLPRPAVAGSMTVGTATVSVTDISDTALTVSGMTVFSYVADGVTVNGNITTGSSPVGSVLTRIRRTTYYDYNTANDSYTITEVTAIKTGNNTTVFIINAWVASYNNGIWTKGSQIATNVIYGSVEMEDADGCYLYNVGSGDNAQTLRFEDGVFYDFGPTGITEATMRNSFSYHIKNSEDSAISYTYACIITNNYSNATGTDNLFIFNADTSYAVTVTTPETVNISPVTGNTCTVGNTVTGS